MWHHSMTNIRPLQLVIVYSTGADYGSLLAPVCVCVWVWVDGGGGTDRDRRRAFCRTLIQALSWSAFASRAHLCPAAGHIPQLLSDLIAEDFSLWRVFASLRFYHRADLKQLLQSRFWYIQQPTVPFHSLWTFQPQGEIWDYCSSKLSPVIKYL